MSVFNKHPNILLFLSGEWIVYVCLNYLSKVFFFFFKIIFLILIFLYFMLIYWDFLL
jgi:hypothetical protein